MSAIFNAPVAAVLLAVELLLFEWRPRSFIPVAIASAVAAAVRVPLLAGIITRGDLVRALEKSTNARTVLEAGSRHLIVTSPDEILHDAVTRMVHHDIGRLPVVRRDNPRHVLGYLGRASIMTARLRRHEEENHREAGWLQAFTQ